jgi:hypothetical protein
MLLDCARQLADRQGLEKPVYPGQWAVDEEASEEIREIAAVCRRIYQRAELLCQPSESFDVRWESGWRRLNNELDDLRSLLAELN